MARFLSWPSASRSQSRPLRRMLLALAGAACLLGALALAGCGVTTTTGVGGGPGNSGASGAPNPGGPRLPAGSPTSTDGGVHGTTVRACVGSTAAPEKTPNIVLTVKNSHQTTKAHVGDVIEIQLPAKMRWNAPSMNSNGALIPLQPQGGMDEATQTCRWAYLAHAKGTLTLSYTGVFICESGSACPEIAEDEEFTIQIG